MNIALIEDEFTARENLKIVLNNIDASIKIVGEADSIEAAILLIQNTPNIDLAIFDIELADGNSFEIFKKINVGFPVIFATAYNQFAIDAFKVNSVDYLLKPIVEEELKSAIDKFKSSNKNELNLDAIQKSIQSLNQIPSYKENFLIEQGDSLIPIRTENIAYFYIENEIIKCKDFNNETYYLKIKLEDIYNQINPNQFYRVNRQFIVNKKAIEKISFYFNGRLLVHVLPKTKDQIIVSKAGATSFKNWMS